MDSVVRFKGFFPLNLHTYIIYCLQRWLYWSDWGSVAKIEKASMDGENRTVIHDSDLVEPNGLTLDYDQLVLYWIDAYRDMIECSSVNGSNRRVVSSERIFQPFDISFYRGTLYFTDLLTGVNKVASNGGTVTTVFSSHHLCSETVGIEVVTSEQQPTGMLL